MEKELSKIKDSLDIAVRELKTGEKLSNDQLAQVTKAAKEREKILREEVDRLVDQAKKDSDAFAQKLKESNDEKLKIQGRIDQYEKELRNKDNMHDMAMIEMKKEITLLESKINAKNAEINELVKTVQIKETTIYDLQKRVADLESTGAQNKENSEHEIAELHEKISGLEEKVRVLDQKLLQRNNTIKEDKATIEQLEAQVQELTDSKNALSKSYLELKEKDEKFTVENQEQSQRLKQLESEKKSDLEEIDQLKNLLNEKIQQIQILEELKDEKENALKILDRTKSSMIKDLQKQLEKEKKMADLVPFDGPTARISRAASTISVRSNNLNNFTPDEKTLQEENHSLINKVAELQSEKWRLEDDLIKTKNQLIMAQRAAGSASAPNLQSNSNATPKSFKVPKTTDPKVLTEAAEKMSQALEEVMNRNAQLQKEIERLKSSSSSSSVRFSGDFNFFKKN